MEQNYETSLKGKDLRKKKKKSYTMFINGKHPYCTDVNSFANNFIQRNHSPHRKVLVWVRVR